MITVPQLCLARLSRGCATWLTPHTDTTRFSCTDTHANAHTHFGEHARQERDRADVSDGRWKWEASSRHSRDSGRTTAYESVTERIRTNLSRLEAALRTLLQRRLSLRLHRLMDGSEMIARITRPVGNIAAGLVCFRTAGTAGAPALTLRFGTGRQGTAAGWLGVSLVSSRSSASERSRPVDRFVLGASRSFGSRSRLSPSFKLTAL